MKNSLFDVFKRKIISFKYFLKKSRFEKMDMQTIFNTIYHINHWKNPESKSGPGSTIEFMKDIIPEINLFIEKYGIHSILDIPCGDFNWARYLKFESIKYIGADIVHDLIKRNEELYSAPNISFQVLDLTKDPLPHADLLLVRDCLVHFSFSDIQMAINNIKLSDAKYLMTTSFVKTKYNININTGEWRPVNLTLPPFNFPPPMCAIDEKFPERFKRFDKGKILGVWLVKDL